MTTGQWLSLIEVARDLCLWIAGGCTAAWLVMQLVGGSR